MTYRLLDVDSEWPRLEPEFTSRGFPLPDPQFAMIVGAFDAANTLQGFLVCQLQFHFEPLVIYSPHALRGLVMQMESELLMRTGPARYFAFASSETVAGICKAVGMQQVTLPLFFKEISAPKTPPPPAA